MLWISNRRKEGFRRKYACRQSGRGQTHAEKEGSWIKRDGHREGALNPAGWGDAAPCILVSQRAQREPRASS